MCPQCAVLNVPQTLGTFTSEDKICAHDAILCAQCAVPGVQSLVKQ